MQKYEFEKAYGRKVSDKRWREIEAEYMRSNALDRLDFVAELKAREKAKICERQAINGLEISRHNITEAQFRAYVRNCLKEHPLEDWREWITPEIGHGNVKAHTTRHDWGATETNEDINGHFQTFLRQDDGYSYNLIYEFSEDSEDGKGSGYCFIYDSMVAEATRRAQAAN